MSGLRLFFLGVPEIREEDRAIRFDTIKAVALLSYLALSETSQTREKLSGLLWPDYPQERAYANLRRTIWSIRKALSGEWLVSRGQYLSLGKGPWCDVTTFRRQVAQHASKAAMKPGGNTGQALGEALKLYRGDFLQGLSLDRAEGFEEWSYFQAQDLKRDLARILSILIHQRVGAGEIEAAIPYARRLLSLDPLDESAHRELMRLYSWSGNRGAALRQYKVCAQNMRREIGVEPEEETRQLLNQLRRGILKPAEKAPPKSRRANLPLQLNPVLGRERELQDLASLIHDPNCRLITVFGPGGVGKTRLALEFLKRHTPQFGGGSFFISLERVASTDKAYSAMADELGLNSDRVSDIRRRLLTYLQDKEILLILDGVESLKDSEDFFTDLMKALPAGCLISTSRIASEFPGGYTFNLSGLAIPPGMEVDDFESYPAVKLFIQEARRSQHDFTVPEKERADLWRIVKLLDGIPLGIELAAPWIRMMSLGDIGEEIDKRLDFLSARHTSMKAVFESSWALLSPEESRVLAGLSLFSGDFDVGAARTILATSSKLLFSLVAKSLVAKRSARRLYLHPLLIRFARERLLQLPQVYDPAARRYCRYYASFVRRREGLMKGFGQVAALNEIEGEIENIISAWNVALKRRDWETLEQLLFGLSIFYTIRSRSIEGKILFSSCSNDLSADPPPQSAGKSKASLEQSLLTRLTLLLAFLCYRINQQPLAKDYYQRAEPSLKSLDTEDAGFYFALAAGLGTWKNPLHNHPQYWIQKAQALFEESGERWWEISLLNRELGKEAQKQQRFEEARQSFEESLQISQRIGDLHGEGQAIKSLAEAAFLTGDYSRARELYARGCALRSEVWDLSVAWDKGRLGLIEYIQGNYREAAELLGQSIKMEESLGNFASAAWRAIELGEVEIQRGNLPQARIWFEKSNHYYEVSRFNLGRERLFLAKSHLALCQGEGQRAVDLAGEGLRLIQAGQESDLRALGLCYLGRAYLALGMFREAQTQLAASLRIATGGQLISVQLECLETLAHLTAGQGNREGAIKALLFVLKHPACWSNVKERAGKLLKGLSSPYTPEELALLEKGIQGLGVAEVGAGLLGEG